MSRRFFTYCPCLGSRGRLRCERKFGPWRERRVHRIGESGDCRCCLIDVMAVRINGLPAYLPALTDASVRRRSTSMSGIAAILNLDGSPVARTEVERMANVLK